MCAAARYMMLQPARRWSVAFLLPVIAACLNVEEPTDLPRLEPGGHHVLFIGNSLTYTNDLPGTVSALARADASSPQLFPLVRASLPLYGPDRYHPAPLGTYLAALVIYEKVTGHDARLLPAVAEAGGARLSTTEARVRFLQNVAHETIAKF